MAMHYILNGNVYSQDSQTEQSPLVELQKRLGVTISSSKAQVSVTDEIDDKELLELSSRLGGESLRTGDQIAGIQVVWVQEIVS